MTYSCNWRTEPNYNKEAIDLNNKAVELIQSNSDSALILLNKATEIDHNLYIAHSNKVGIYISKDDFEQAINSSIQVVTVKPDLAEAHTMLGMLYDFTSQKDNAKVHYLKALELYNERLAKPNKFILANRFNRAHTLLLLDNNIEGQKAVKELLNDYPEYFDIQLLVDFEKEQYLKTLFEKK